MYYLKLAPIISITPQPQPVATGSGSLATGTTTTTNSTIAAVVAAATTTTTTVTTTSTASTITTTITPSNTAKATSSSTTHSTIVASTGAKSTTTTHTTTAIKSTTPIIVKTSCGSFSAKPVITGANNSTSFNSNSSSKLAKSQIPISTTKCSSPSTKPDVPNNKQGNQPISIHKSVSLSSKDGNGGGDGDNVNPRVKTELDNSLNLSTVNATSSSSNSVSPAFGGGSAAAARLLDLGKRLLEATREGQTEAVRQLVVDQGAPFTSDWLGTTALHMAAQNVFVEIASILLDGGVNRDAKTKLERTALHLAAQSGSVEIVDMLISAGADINARDMLRMTPIHWAVERAHYSVVERLLVAGADLAIKSKFQLTPIDIARNSENYDVIELFNNWMGTGGGNAIQQLPSNSVQSQHQNMQQQQIIHQHQQQQQAQMSLNFSQDLNQLFDNLGAAGFCTTSDNSPLLTHTMSTNLNAGGGNSKSNLFKNHLATSTSANNASGIGHGPLQSNESHDILDWDYQLALIDSANSAMGRNWDNSICAAARNNDIGVASSSPDDDDKTCIDLVEMELNGLEFTPELFMSADDSNDGDESNIEYLMKVVERLKKENKQLRQQVEQLSTTSP